MNEYISNAEQKRRDRQHRKSGRFAIGIAGFLATLFVIGFVQSNNFNGAEDISLFSFLIGIVWLFVFAIASGADDRKQAERKAAKKVPLIIAKHEEKQRMEKALIDAKKTIWRAIDPSVDDADRPTHEQVELAKAFIISQKNA